MTDFSHGELALNRLTVGRSFEDTFVIDPPAGKSASDVQTELTGATATVSIIDADGSTEILANGSITKTVTAAARTLKIEIAAAATSGLTAGIYRWKAYVTTSGAKQWSVRMPTFCQIRVA